MHLTPGCFRVFGKWSTVLTMGGTLLVLAACAPRTDPPPAVPIPIPVEAPPARVESRTLLLLGPDSATYDAISTVVTIERSNPMAALDSTSYAEAIHAVLTSDAASRFRLTLTSDSGYDLPRDRPPPPETIRKNPQAIVSSQLLVGSVRETSADEDSTALCPSKPSLVSPLLTAVMAQYLVHASRAQVDRRTMLQYRVCPAGVLRHIAGFIERNALNAGNRLSITLRLQATIRTDSSRALPMRISGTMEGIATAMPGSGIAVLPSTLELIFAAQFTAESSTKVQRFEQRVTTRLTRRN